MRTQSPQQKRTGIIMMFPIFVFLLSCTIISAYPAQSDEDRYPPEREIYSSPGAHQLASWLTAQLRRNEYMVQPQDLPVLPYRLSGVPGKRNSELTNSMMGIPRNMIDNGRK